MKFDQLKKTADILSKIQLHSIKGGTTESQVTSAIIITEDIDGM